MWIFLDVSFLKGYIYSSPHNPSVPADAVMWLFYFHDFRGKRYHPVSIFSRRIFYGTNLHERETYPAIAFIHGTSDGIVNDGQFAVQHYRQLFCGKDQ